MAEETHVPQPEDQNPDIDPTVEKDLEEALADITEESAAEAEDAQENVEDTVDVDPIAELTEDLQRITAEYANFRRRTEREREAVVTNAKIDVIAQLLPILDDLDLAEKHGDLEGPLKALNDKLRQAVKSFSVEPFGQAGDAFDPEKHEAVQDISTGDEKVIGTVLRLGYALGDKNIRTAMVVIADPE